MHSLLVVLLAAGCGASAGGPVERRPQPGQPCGLGEVATAGRGEFRSDYQPPVYTCVHCARADDVVVAVPRGGPEITFADDRPADWRCKRRCRSDRDCEGTRCVSGWLDPHCTEPGRAAMLDGELSAAPQPPPPPAHACPADHHVAHHTDGSAECVRTCTRDDDCRPGGRCSGSSLGGVCTPKP